MMAEEVVVPLKTHSAWVAVVVMKAHFAEAKVSSGCSEAGLSGEHLSAEEAGAEPSLGLHWGEAELVPASAGSHRWNSPLFALDSRQGRHRKAALPSL